jgi:hypothetical protein
MASANDSRLPPGLLISIAPDALWPRPHSKLFDFDATRAGAQYIDEIAATARGRFAPLGRQVIGHLDWRAEHVRFDGDSPTAYTSRCGHAAGLDLRNQPGTFHHLLWSAGPRLLELCG